MKIDSKRIGTIIFIVIFGSIALSAIAGYWQTESTKQPVRFEEGEFEGMPNPEDIRGSYSFSDVSSAFGLPAEDLIKAFALPEDTNPDAFRNKDLESVYGEIDLQGGEIGNESVKLFVSFYTGLPYESADDTLLPTEAVEILKEKVELTDSQMEFLIKHSVETGKADGADMTSDQDVEESEAEPVKKVKGITTFGEVISWGIASQSIEEIVGKDLPDVSVGIRDFCEANGLEFSTVKARLQEAVDGLE